MYRDRVRSRLIPGKIEEEVRRQPGMAFYYALVNNALHYRLLLDRRLMRERAYEDR